MTQSSASAAAPSVAVPFSTPLEAASAVREFIGHSRSDPHPLVPRHHDRPNDTLWWIVPGTERPAYRYGKLMFEFCPWDRSLLSCGLHVEKGYDYREAPADQRMAPNWTWHRFHPKLAAPEVIDPLNHVGSAVGSPSFVGLLAHAAAGDADRLAFTFADGVLNPFPPGTSFTHPDLLRPMQNVRSLSELRQALASPRLAWYWVNVGLGVTVRLSGRLEVPQTWDAHLLYERLIAPWHSWLF